MPPMHRQQPVVDDDLVAQFEMKEVAEQHDVGIVVSVDINHSHGVGQTCQSGQDLPVGTQNPLEVPGLVEIQRVPNDDQRITCLLYVVQKREEVFVLLLENVSVRAIAEMNVRNEVDPATTTHRLNIHRLYEGTV